MKTKAGEIIDRVSEIRAFTDDSYLKTTYLVVFLLIGCTDQTKETFENRAREIIVDKKAIVFLQVDDSEDVVADVRVAVDDVRKSGVDIRNLNRLHFCPFIISDAADPACFKPIVDQIEAYKTSREVEVLWKPFIILDPDNPGASLWLDAITDVIKNLTEAGASNCCRLCVMTREDESGFTLHEGRLLDTVLFTALLHANAETQEGIGRLIAYRGDYPEDYFYTAQTVFISNPVIMRTLRCMHLILERVISDERPENEIELGFIKEILSPIFEKLPQENGRISFTPLYGVMPSLDKNTAKFMERLKDFARKYYLSGFEYNKLELFKRFRIEFLRAFIRSGKSDDYLQSIIGNAQEIEKLSRTSTAFQMNALEPISVKSGMARESMDVFKELEARLRHKLATIASDIFSEFLRSDGFNSLPGLYNDAKKRIKEVSTELYDEVMRRRRRSGDEIFLELSGDPDEVLVVKSAKILQDQQIFPKFISEITMCLEASDVSGASAAEEKLINSIFEQVRGLSGGSGAREYMNLFSLTCSDNHSEEAKRCIEAIAEHFKFPIRFQARGGRKRTFVWGSEENHFFSAWEGQQEMFDTDTEYLKIKSKERVVLLTVSSAFKRTDIRGVR